GRARGRRARPRVRQAPVGAAGMTLGARRPLPPGGPKSLVSPGAPRTDTSTSERDGIRPGRVGPGDIRRPTRGPWISARRVSGPGRFARETRSRLMRSVWILAVFALTLAGAASAAAPRRAVAPHAATPASAATARRATAARARTPAAVAA